MTKTAIVCAAGPKEEIVSSDFLLSYKNSLFIGADYGAIYLLNAGIIPHIAIGDFDSLQQHDWERIQQQIPVIEKYKAEKNETDTELAILRAIEAAPEEIIVLGATGGRLDHYEANVHLMYRLQKKYPHIRIQMVNKTNKISFLKAGTTQLPFDETYHYVSFFAFDEIVQDVTLKNMRYETERALLQFGVTRFTSNEILKTGATITFSNGMILMIQSID